MLEFYNVNYFIYVNGEKLYGLNNTLLKEDSTVTEGTTEVKSVTWENVEDLYKYDICCSIVDTKKGKILRFYPDWPAFGTIRTAKEWKEEINIPVYCEMRQIKVSLKKVIEWHNAEEAIQYLNEHGLSISGALK